MLLDHFLHLHRVKAYNVSQLVMYVAEAFEAYIQKRLLDVALGCRAPSKVKTNSLSCIDPTSVMAIGNNQYKVPSASTVDKT